MNKQMIEKTLFAKSAVERTIDTEVTNYARERGVAAAPGTAQFAKVYSEFLSTERGRNLYTKYVDASQPSSF